MLIMFTVASRLFATHCYLVVHMKMKSLSIEYTFAVLILMYEVAWLLGSLQEWYRCKAAAI